MKKQAGINPYAMAAVEAFGAYPESLVNAATAEGIELKKIQRINTNTLGFEAYERELDKLKHLAAQCSVELKIIKYQDRQRRMIKNRFILLPLVFSLLLCLLLSSLFIWQIDIRGAQRLSHGEIMRALEDSGLDVGCFWPGLEADEIRSRVMLKVPEIGWMTVNISGSRAVVVVQERQEKPEIYDESKAADLVAGKTGLVRRVSVLSGNTLVEPGQAVAAGEMLASGRLISIMGAERTVRARGTVMADTWYEIDSVCPEEMELKEYSGFTRHRFALIFGKRRINLYISSGKAIDECDKIIDEYTLGLEGHFALPLRFVHERIVSYDHSTGRGFDSETMAAQLRRMLDEQVEGQILQSAFTEASADGLYVLTLRAHCVENIAETRELEG